MAAWYAQPPWLSNKQPISNDMLFAKPDQIFRPPQVLGCSRADLGAELGIYVNVPKRDCFNIY
jgi:hypothetical protein